MTDISFNKWSSSSDKGLTEQIGAFVRHHRIEQNKTQGELAKAAGISRSTLSLLERGDSHSHNTDPGAEGIGSAEYHERF